MAAYISEADQLRLSQQVTEVERHTAGELVVVVLKKSATYSTYRLTASVAFALLAVGAMHLRWPLIPAGELLGTEVVALALSFWGLAIPALLRRVVPRPVQQQAVSDRTRQLFIELGVTETRERSGVLIVLSLLEHRIEILGDRGIHEHLGAQAWAELVQSFTQAARRGSAVEGLSQVISRIGAELRARFPARTDDVNELPDAVRVEK